MPPRFPLLPPGGPSKPTGIKRTVTASIFGGPNDPGTGTTGYHGDNLNQHPDSFAELSTNPSAGLSQLDFAALGGLPYLTPVTVSYNGRSMTLYKRDVGAGGAGIGGNPRAIDIWYSSAAKLGIRGLAIVQVDIGVAGGGTAGLGGTGTPANQVSPSLWTVGDPSNPDQDYWTTINQYSMDAQWYTFSDGETLFVADGIELMAQEPTAVISRLDPAVIHAECTYDNTAFQFVSTHTRKGRIQRRTSLARVTSPTEVTVQIICDIDQFRAGDLVQLSLFGPADGPWLIGDCTRDVMQPYSELTLVQAMQPINAATGLQAGPAYLTGKQASAPASGTVQAAMITEAAKVNNADYPYVYAGGHASAGTASVGSPGPGYDGHTIGYDCSGAVGAVLAAGGLLPWGAAVSNDAGIIQTLLSQKKIAPGQGTGRPECTLFDNPGEHIFMRLNGVYWGTSDGGGGNHSQPNGGAGWLYDSHADVASFNAYHVPQAILGQQAGGTGGF